MLLLFGLFVSLGGGRMLFELVVQPHSHQTDRSGQDEDENGGGKITGNQRSSCQRGAEDGGQMAKKRSGRMLIKPAAQVSKSFGVPGIKNSRKEMRSKRFLSCKNRRF